MRSRVDFQRIQGKGRRVTTASFVLLVAAREQEHAQAPARLGITASRRFGNAVARNRLKRIVREAFRVSDQLFDPGLDLVVIPRPQAAKLTSTEVLAEWVAAAPRLQKAARAARQDHLQRRAREAALEPSEPAPDPAPQASDGRNT